MSDNKAKDVIQAFKWLKDNKKYYKAFHVNDMQVDESMNVELYFVFQNNANKNL